MLFKTSDGGLLHVGIGLGIRTMRFYPPVPAGKRSVFYFGELDTWQFPRLVFAVKRVGLHRQLHCFKIADGAQLTPNTKLRPMFGNTLDNCGEVCLGVDKPLNLNDKELIEYFWNTGFTMPVNFYIANKTTPRRAAQHMSFGDKLYFAMQAAVMVLVLALSFAVGCGLMALAQAVRLF